MTEIVQKWFYDGKYYDSQKEADIAKYKHQQQYDNSLYELAYGKYSNHLPKNTPLTSIGYWLIEDEGPVDFGSSGRPIRLAICHGTLINAIKHAHNLPGFWGYGPGYIQELKIIEV